eukprot:CAMPEP_0204642478 /NCGR_PEP_ID=MMETSP0717-20131115/51707_1 /ASSEMBLY_ACC=CAM_ASM_000666 /TAXON_ID=230516 /ORGANISM="Chaetoceros curvisetus" /LENGTH=263 /DNA_ID=CAMNT_0051663247 /DNA_START=17 /DNA_END=808 /DNA_ORIENTATION=-
MNSLVMLIASGLGLAARTTEAFSTSHPKASTCQLKAVTVPDDGDLWNEETLREDSLPKYSASIPFLKRPKELKLELAGDVGFDPLNLSKNRELLFEYREAEIKHSRLAMLAAVGWPLSELYDPTIALNLSMEPVLDANNRVPSLFNGGLDKISPVWWGFCLGLTAAIDLYGVNRSRTLPPSKYTPGDLGFDPLNLYPSKDDIEGQKKMQLAEIKHGRLAMIAVTAFSVQEFVSGVGIVDETPLIFKPIATSEAVLEEIVNRSM